MMFGFRFAAAALAAFACAGFAPTALVTYDFTPVLQDGVLRAVQVDLGFRGDADGETGIRLPNNWGGQQELWRSIDALTIVSGAAMRDGEGPDHRVLTHRPGARIHVRYRVIQDWQGEPNAERGNEYRPVIQPTYFHLIGDAALIIPEVDNASPVRVRARHMPRSWSFASDLQHPGLTLGRANASISVGGDYRIVRGADPSIRIAIRGQWHFTDADFTARVSRIVAGQRRFWGDGAPPYLVTVTQISAPDPGWLSLGGTGLDDSFAFFATPNAEERPVARTLAHESIHTWIPGRIGGAQDEENEAIQYWLSEGFTDFYTGRLLVRDGLWSPTEFAAEFNQMLLEYAHSPVRTEPNTRVLADFWTDRDVQRLPYQRGQMLATIWDARLRAAGARDFDDVVFEMRARASAGDPLKAVQMFPIVAEAMGLDVRPDIAAYIDAGTPILLPEDLFAPCGRIETRDVPNFHRGFDIAATQANHNVITGVDPQLPAYAAGLRDGMVLVRRDGGDIGNAEREIGYVVRDGDAERTIRYMPRGRGAYTLQRFELDPALAGDNLNECVRVLGGA